VASIHYFDTIILGWWSAGLFASIFLPAQMSVAILDKSNKLWTKLLLSWWERCNVTNIDIDPTRDYVGQNLKALPGIFHAFDNQDMIEFLASHGIETIVEDRGRVLLKSGKAKQLRDLLVNLATEHGVEFFLGETVTKVKHNDWIFTLTTDKEIFQTKNLIVATGGKSYPQVGATGLGYELAEQFGIGLVAPRVALCGIQTIEDVSELAGSPLQWTLRVFAGQKMLYQQTWSLLFTHRWLSGPVAFDASLWISQALQSGKQDFNIQIDVDVEHTSKKIFRFFPLLAKTASLSFGFQSLRPWEEAKVSSWWVALDQLDKCFQSKNVPWLYFIGEVLDVTGRSGWYNLQWAWSSAYVCATAGMQSRV